MRRYNKRTTNIKEHIKYTINFPIDLYENMTKKCLELGIDRSQLIRIVVEEYLRKPKGKINMISPIKDIFGSNKTQLDYEIKEKAADEKELKRLNKNQKSIHNKTYEMRADIKEMKNKIDSMVGALNSLADRQEQLELRMIHREKHPREN